jgi:hypothetical protein
VCIALSNPPKKLTILEGICAPNIAEFIAKIQVDNPENGAYLFDALNCC